MRKPPVQIATPSSATDITDEVRKLLRAAGIGEELPTPKAAILACARLVESGEIDLQEYEATFVDKTVSCFHRAISKVAGFLDRRSRIVYVDPAILDSRRSFVTYHEVAHQILPWQRITYTEDDDSTLSPECKNLFESEANYGAAEILFQCERFEDQGRDYSISIESALYLAGQFGASCHAALRRFVERNHRPCLLLILKPTSRENPDGRISYFVVYSIASESFSSEFAEALQVNFINPTSELGRILNGAGDAAIALTNERGFTKICTVERFNNSFNTFLMIYPRQIGRPRIVAQFKGLEL